MTLVRLDVRFVALDALVEEANRRHVVVALTDADTIVTLGSLHDRLTKPLGVWLELSEDYSAQMAGARRRDTELAGAARHGRRERPQRRRQRPGRRGAAER